MRLTVPSSIVKQRGPPEKAAARLSAGTSRLFDPTCTDDGFVRCRLFFGPLLSIFGGIFSNLLVIGAFRFSDRFTTPHVLFVFRPLRSQPRLFRASVPPLGAVLEGQLPYGLHDIPVRVDPVAVDMVLSRRELDLVPAEFFAHGDEIGEAVEQGHPVVSGNKVGALGAVAKLLGISDASADSDSGGSGVDHVGHPGADEARGRLRSGVCQTF